MCSLHSDWILGHIRPSFWTYDPSSCATCQQTGMPVREKISHTHAISKISYVTWYAESAVVTECANSSRKLNQIFSPNFSWENSSLSLAVLNIFLLTVKQINVEMKAWIQIRIWLRYILSPKISSHIWTGLEGRLDNQQFLTGYVTNMPYLKRGR